MTVVQWLDFDEHLTAHTVAGTFRYRDVGVEL